MNGWDDITKQVGNVDLEVKNADTVKNRFKRTLERANMHESDLERRALFYVLCGNDDLYSKIQHIYDFEDNSIKPDCLESEDVDFSGGSAKLIRLAFNLYNGFPADISDTFYSLDEANSELAINAIKLRFGI
jgi:hypothetical protein